MVMDISIPPLSLCAGEGVEFMTVGRWWYAGGEMEFMMVDG